MKIGTENIDEVLFDYFEGNLSEYEKKEVKQFIDDNPAYLEDFRLWEVSNAKQYISEPAAVDRSLLIKGTMSWTSKWFLFGISSVCVVLITVFMLSFDQEEKGKTIENSTLPVMETYPSSSVESLFDDKTPASKNELVRKKPLVPEKEEHIEPEQKTELIVVEEKRLDSVKIIESRKEIETIQEDSSESVSNASIEITKKELTKRELRKEVREIEKHKQRARDRRQQQEFMKGNKPYVVPLNPKGF